MAEQDRNDSPAPSATDVEPGQPSSLWAREPFATFRAEPRLFAIGLPIVFVVGAVVGAVFMRESLQVALASQLAIQTLGFLWLYVPALKRRRSGG